jgi:hypothetical protein
MVLYEDLRAFTAWRAEMSGTRSQRLVYRYTGSEWEALGDLCLRLHRLVSHITLYFYILLI